MTTIAYKDGVLASDTGSSFSGTYAGMVHKIIQAKDGSMCGLAGRLIDANTLMEWLLEGGDRESLPEFIEDGAEGILISPEGKAEYITAKGIFQIDAPFYAEGSGALIAIGAMAQGATARQAVAIAIKYDEGTYGPIEAYSINKGERL